MTTRAFAVALALVLGPLMVSTGAPAVRAAESYELPPEVTPALRAACEKDVRRLCIGENPTVAKVKACVTAKFLQLGRRCQIELASAGLSR